MVAVHLAGFHRHQALRVGLARHPKQNAVAESRLALGRQGRPGGELMRLFEGLAVDFFVVEPAHDRRGETDLIDSSAEQRLKTCLDGRHVERRGFVGPDPLGGATLHKQAFAAVERRQFIVGGGQRLNLALDGEQGGDEILQMGRQIDHELGRLAAILIVRRGASGAEPGAQITIGCGYVSEEGGIQLDQSIPLIEVVEFKPKGQGKRAHNPAILPLSWLI